MRERVGGVCVRGWADVRGGERWARLGRWGMRKWGGGTFGMGMVWLGRWVCEDVWEGGRVGLG